VTDSSSIPGQQPSRKIDASVPHSARIWNYWLGGKDYYPVDQAAGNEFAAIYPGIFDLARSSRYFLGRTIRYLAGEVGIRQFLDIGTGLPTVDNTHDVAQGVSPECRIVYVDNDPLVLVHAEALLISAPEGVTTYIEADLHDPGSIVREAAKTLDFDEPIALILMQILGHEGNSGEDEGARSIVRNLMDALPPGSYLALDESADTNELNAQATRLYNESGAVPYHLRRPEQIIRLFEGLELVEPGVVPIHLWRPESDPFGTLQDVGVWGGIGRKP
jgi:hypothetical protein